MRGRGSLIQLEHFGDRTQAKGVEFDDLRERMLPTRELDLLRIRVAEELDAPHRVYVSFNKKFALIHSGTWRLWRRK